MATTQATLDETARYEVVDYDVGDLLRREGHRVYLRECPICRTDPTRPRYHFGRQENRPRHFREEHGADPQA